MFTQVENIILISLAMLLNACVCANIGKQSIYIQGNVQDYKEKNNIKIETNQIISTFEK